MPLQSKSDPDLDARWAAWLERGAAHDRAGGRLFIFVPAAFVLALTTYLLLIR